MIPSIKSSKRNKNYTEQSDLSNKNKKRDTNRVIRTLTKQTEEVNYQRICP